MAHYNNNAKIRVPPELQTDTSHPFTIYPKMNVFNTNTPLTSSQLRAYKRGPHLPAGQPHTTDTPKTPPSTAQRNNPAFSPPTSMLQRIPALLYRIVILVTMSLFCYKCFFVWPHENYHLDTLQCVLTGMFIAYVVAFYSLALQVNGLIGPRCGILPVDEYLEQLSHRSIYFANGGINFCIHSAIKIWKFGCSYSLFRAHHVAYLGFAISIFGLVFQFRSTGVLTEAILKGIIFFILYLLYLSFKFVGQGFLSFQWDNLLLESGWLSIIGSLCSCPVTPFSASLVVFCFRLLAFKLVFCSGIRKFGSGCPYWSSNTGLDYYFWTQPMPNPLSWYSHWKSHKRLISISASIIECIIPFFMFGSKLFRVICSISFSGLMLAIWASGNFGFLSLTSIVISFSILDDSFLKIGFNSQISSIQDGLPWFHNIIGAVLLFIAFSWWILYTLANGLPLMRVWRHPQLKPFKIFMMAYDWVEPLSICNTYGLFSAINTHRYEICIDECHNIGGAKRWIELSFIYKPGHVSRPPSWLWWGHFPRLDWRMWFIPIHMIKASSNVGEAKTKNVAPYWYPFLKKLRQREPEVVKLMGKQTFDLTQMPPPIATRIRLFEYRFVPPTELPKYYGYAPPGIALTHEDQELLKSQLENWEIGKWWMRHCIFVMDANDPITL